MFSGKVRGQRANVRLKRCLPSCDISSCSTHYDSVRSRFVGKGAESFEQRDSSGDLFTMIMHKNGDFMELS